VTTTVGSAATFWQNATPSTYAAMITPPSLADALDAADAQSDAPASTVSLSPAAKALAAQSSSAAKADTPLAQVAAAARDWFDQQYDSSGISSALLDGKVAVDFTSQSRATLSAVASNAGGLFTSDEQAAAKTTLGARFDATLNPAVVVARHTGNYAGLYTAALSYMSEAGADEQATAAWQNQHQALLDGLAAARQNFGKAPDTGNVNDPVHALLNQASPGDALPSSATTADVAARARALLDQQAAAARDSGKELVFDAHGKSGQAVDFSPFSNRMLATITLNQGSDFSATEVLAARAELNQRTRQGLLGTFNAGGGGPLAMIQQYRSMSDEEKSALGVSGNMLSGMVQNYATLLKVQNMLGQGGSGLSGYL